MQYIEIKELDNGSLGIYLTKDGKEYMHDRYSSQDAIATWVDLLESYSTNGSYMLIMPEHIGALTDAPIIGINVGWDDNGEFEEHENAKYWWFPDYMVINELRKLYKDGVIFFESASVSTK